MFTYDEWRHAFAVQQKIELLGIAWTVVDLVQVHDAIRGPLLRLRLMSQPDPGGVCLDGLIRLTLREHKPETSRDEHLAQCREWANEAIQHLPPGVVLSQLINSLSHHDATWDHEAIAQMREQMMQGRLETPDAVRAFVEGIQ